ncbi:hypothetical protein BEN78_06200 [Xanthomonas citri pv. mangiferaeindicae]|nr:hypothetical protein BEN78_06200 [Xanthomonas citri pv. mangiferaeindicae]
MSVFRHRRLLSTGLLCVLLAACARPSGETASEYAADAPPPPAEAMQADAMSSPAAGAGPAAEAEAGVDAAVQMASGTLAQTDPARRFILAAQARFAVDDVYRSALAIEDLAAAQGGFVVANRIRSETQGVQRHRIGDGKLLELIEYTTAGELTVRVPSDRAQTFLRELAKQMKFLDSRDFDARDVQFDLLRQQLAYARSQELQQSLAQAVQTGDRLDRKGDAFAARERALAARDEARVTQREVEDRIAFATIDLSLYQPSQVRHSERVDPEAVFAQQRPGFFVRIGHALRGGWQGLLDTGVVVALLWPLWLFVAIVVIAWRAWRRRRATARS